MSELATLCEAIEADWPEHAAYLARLRGALGSERLDAESVAASILRIAGDDLAGVCADYRWLCGEMVREQLHFRRHKRYRLSTFAEAREQVYDEPAFMERYLRGLLVGRVAWLEQLRMFAMYVREYLPRCADGYAHLEIGPGHGLLLHRALTDPRCASVTGLDVSESSLAATRGCLSALGAPSTTELMPGDLLASDFAQGRAWDSVVVSEVLEHLEDPVRAMNSVVGALRPGGLAFITAPATCPMPDHIHLFETPEEVLALVTDAGLVVEQSRIFTPVGIDEDRARSSRLPLACAVIARRPGQ